MKAKRTLADFGELTEAEARIVAEIDTQEVINLGSLSDENDSSRKVRAEFIRYLSLGGCVSCQMSEKSLLVSGALIEGIFDLNNCIVKNTIGLFNCRFLENLTFQDTSFSSIMLSGSHFQKGLLADRMNARGNVTLRRIVSTGQIRLIGATIGGDLDLSEVDIHVHSARKTNSDVAVHLQGVTINGACLWRQNIKRTVFLISRARQSVSSSMTASLGLVRLELSV